MFSTKIPRNAAIALAATAALALSGCNGNPTWGEEWLGDSSDCIGTTDVDVVIQTIGGDVGGISQEFGSETPSYVGKPGCDAAYVIDYLMPAAGTNVNPGWDWAWIHVASRIENIDEDLCENLWTSLRVYGYWTFQGVAQEELLLESYRKGVWNGFACDFGFPDNVWISSAYTRVRAVSQHGAAFLALQPHYSYFVTNLGPSASVERTAGQPSPVVRQERRRDEAR